eukprot:CAMPEP_0203758616 /NCGR_PEP_ID=MMETSP0098-20131031/11467_1 /ASSEMBLY_ACC=CAM_ASM_000208 /TAXON_ID=96639 /ORGANISM=" , Strain NY0313808BC1" /LENGTH=636 /DNA_ID=CAMNT_0050651149 /DNA_START=1260 /DNA_END=3167 /DNA_ORIENTATION=-
MSSENGAESSKPATGAAKSSANPFRKFSNFLKDAGLKLSGKDGKDGTNEQTSVKESEGVVKNRGRGASVPLNVSAPPPPTHGLPDGCSVVPYTSKGGDTPAGVAMAHGMSVGQLRQLNKMYGTSSLYPGQVLLVVVPKDESPRRESRSLSMCPDVNTNRTKGLKESRKSSGLGGEIFEPVIVVDDAIHVLGHVEVNSHFLAFVPHQFQKTLASSGSIPLEDSNKILKSYGFRLDLRDIEGCSARSLDSLGDKVPEKLDFGTPSIPDESGDGVDEDGFCVQLFWTLKTFGFVKPRPILFFMPSLVSCTSMTVGIQGALQRQREKSERYAMMNMSQSNSLTNGALISGLLAKPDSAPRDAEMRANSLTSVDLVQHALMKGEISADEAKLLRQKNQEVLERMADLEDSMKKAPIAESGKPNLSRRRTRSLGSWQSISAELNTRNVQKPAFTKERSKILEDDKLLTELNMELPEAVRCKHWTVLYEFDSCGVSLKELYKKVSGYNETLLLIQTTDLDVFGAYASEQWTPTRAREFYGTGESFVFTFKPDLQVFAWTGANDFIMSSSASHLGMGAGGGFAFCLDDDLDQGTSSPCVTFGTTEPLPRKPEFRVAQLEVIGFDQLNRSTRSRSIGNDSDILKT